MLAPAHHIPRAPPAPCAPLPRPPHLSGLECALTVWVQWKREGCSRRVGGAVEGVSVLLRLPGGLLLEEQVARLAALALRGRVRDGHRGEQPPGVLVLRVRQHLLA